jgi:hypothetical protein
MQYGTAGLGWMSPERDTQCLTSSRLPGLDALIGLGVTQPFRERHRMNA